MSNKTKQTQHTPGPWKPCRYHEDFNGLHFDVEEEDREQYAAKPYTSIEAAEGIVANAHDLFEFKDADAHLIAAAPDLLEACESALALLEEYRERVIKGRITGDLLSGDYEATKALRVAIAKAKGE